jgi:hypothetical protein
MKIRKIDPRGRKWPRWTPADSLSYLVSILSELSRILLYVTISTFAYPSLDTHDTILVTDRVARWVYEKISQNIAKMIFC